MKTRVLNNAIVGLLAAGLVFASMFVVNLTLARADEPASEPAQGGTALTLSPATTKTELKPGDHYNGVLKVLNSGSGQIGIKVYASPYHVTNDSYDPEFETRDERSEIADWIKFESTEDITIAPKQTAEVKYTVDVPTTAMGGGQYAVLFAESVDPKVNQTQTGVTIGKRVGGLFFSKIEGDMKVDGSILEQSVESWYQESEDFQTFARVQNTGNVDAGTTYQTKVKGLFGNDVFATDEKTNTVLPSTTRKVVMKWDDAKWGIYQVEQNVNWNGQDSSVAKWVLVAPLWFLITLGVSVIVVILLIVIIVLVSKQSKKRKAARAKAAGEMTSDEYQEYLKWKTSQATPGSAPE